MGETQHRGWIQADTQNQANGPILPWRGAVAPTQTLLLVLELLAPFPSKRFSRRKYLLQLVPFFFFLSCRKYISVDIFREVFPIKNSHNKYPFF